MERIPICADLIFVGSFNINYYNYVFHIDLLKYMISPSSVQCFIFMSSKCCKYILSARPEIGEPIAIPWCCL
jgi:hypothetical protein